MDRERIVFDPKPGRKYELQRLALDERVSVSELMNEALEDLLTKRAKEEKKRRRV
jgi:hypothetical protein